MNEEQRRIVEQLRSNGFAVIVWTPDELKNASPTRVEDRSIEIGWGIIEDLQ